MRVYRENKDGTIDNFTEGEDYQVEGGNIVFNETQLLNGMTFEY